ncbi:MAG: 50S ribosomal protein L3 [bacterium]
MDRFILGVKKNQSQQFDKTGSRVVTTTIETTPNYLLDIKLSEKNGYSALVIGYGEGKNIPKPVLGLLKKANVEKKLKYVQEFRFDPTVLPVTEKEGKKCISFGEVIVEIGQELKPNLLFALSDPIVVTATSKGKGFQGVVRRHAFKGGSKTHGQSDRQRAPGSIGMSTTPGRVFKGKRMAGRMGNETVTIKGLSVMETTETGLVLKGLVPGAIGGLVRIKRIS